MQDLDFSVHLNLVRWLQQNQLNVIYKNLIIIIFIRMFKNLEPEIKAVINKVQISRNPERFIDSSTKVNHKDIYTLKAIILKVLAKILPSEAVFESYAQVGKIEFVGSATETLPQGKEKAFKGKIQLYKIVGQVFTKTEAFIEKISEFYFHCDTFNIFTLNDGKVTKQINIQSGQEKQINQVIKGVVEKQQEEVVERKVRKRVKKEQSDKVDQEMKQIYKQDNKETQWLRINNINNNGNNKTTTKVDQNKAKNKKDYIKQKLQKEVKEKNWGYNQITFHQNNQAINLRDDNDLLQQLHHTLVKIGIIVQLYAHTLERKFKLSGKVQIINPNRTIKEAQFKNELVIKIEDSDHLSYYFSNPELLPIFIRGTVPQEILEYNKQINQQMETLRKNQTTNIYEKQYHILNKQFIAGTKIYIYQGDAYRYYKGAAEPIKWLNDAGFKVTHQVHQTDLLRSQKYDIIWVTSSTLNSLSANDIDYIVNQYQQGVGLFLWADNDPHFMQANKILEKIISPQFQLVGNYLGQKLLKASDQIDIGTFDMNHPVASGFATLHEGVTICHPNIVHPDIQVFAYNTSPQKQQSLVYRRPKNNQGYLWIDNGFTKYMNYNQKVFEQSKHQVEQYIINVCSFIMKKKKI